MSAQAQRVRRQGLIAMAKRFQEAAQRGERLGLGPEELAFYDALASNRLRVMVRTLLRRYKYPPDRQEEATKLVLKQAESLSQEWVASA